MPSMLKLLNSIRNYESDVALAFAAYEVLIERMENRLAYTRELLAHPLICS